MSVKKAPFEEKQFQAFDGKRNPKPPAYVGFPAGESFPDGLSICWISETKIE
jgi:hypothetical protein